MTGKTKRQQLKKDDIQDWVNHQEPGTGEEQDLTCEGQRIR